MPQIQQKAQFSFIRYANCWEDADILLPALNISREDICLSITSAGDNTLSLLTKTPRKVVAFDVSAPQQACLELRIAAFRNFSYQKLLEFLGIKSSLSRLEDYLILKPSLSKASQQFWQENQGLIEEGIIHSGKFERYFKLFRTIILRLIHNKKIQLDLLKAKTQEGRRIYYNSKWNTIRWRFLFNLFFSRRVMGILGRDPSFFKYVEASVASSIMKRVEYALTILPTDTNPYLNYILTGNFPLTALPHYLRISNYEIIRENLDKIQLFKGTLKELIKQEPNLRFDAFNLSDIFEYMSLEEFHETLKMLSEISNKGARIAFWNMLADRTLDGNTFFMAKNDRANELFLKDKSFFYKRFIIGEKK